MALFLRRKKDRVVLVALADTHGGNKLGLMNPNVTLYAEGEHADLEPWTPEPSEIQKYLWSAYLEDIDRVVKLADGDDIIILHVGDATQGLKYPALLVSDRAADQVLIATANLEVWFKYPNVHTMRLAVGTPAHVFGHGSAEVLICEMLNRPRLGRGVKVVYHGELNCHGVGVNYTHKGPGPGIRDHTKGNQVRYYLRDHVTRAWKRGEVAARLWLRAHYHSLVHETAYDTLGGKPYTFDLFLLPSYCGMGEYARGATRGDEVQTHGLLAFEIEDGRLVRHYEFTRTLDLRTRESI